jgi:hypothetical protein
MKAQKRIKIIYLVTKKINNRNKNFLLNPLEKIRIIKYRFNL